MYSLATRPDQSRVELAFSGHMAQDAEAFFAELTDAAQQVRRPSGWWDLLVDFSNTPVMPEDRARNTSRIFDWCRCNGVRKIAFIMQSVTQELQIRRLTGDSPLVSTFENRRGAECWLAGSGC